MRIEAYTLDQLEALLADHDYWRRSVLPITRHRLLSQISNPRAEAADVGLIVAYEDGPAGDVAAYIGVLPDTAHLGSGPVRFGWLSCWWVNPEHMATGVAALLLFRALHAYGGRVGSYNPAPMAEHVLLATRRLVPLHQFQGFTAILRLNTAYLLERKAPGARYLRPALSLVDAAGNLLVDAGQALQRAMGRRRPACGLEYVNRIDGQVEAFMDRHRDRDDLFRRGKPELQWIHDHPWVLPAPLPDTTSTRYAFTAVAKAFAVHLVKIMDAGGQMVGFVMLKRRDRLLTVPYAFFATDHAALVLDVVVAHAVALKTDMVTLFHPRLVAAAATRDPRLLGRWSSSRRCFIGAAMGSRLGACQLQDGDGDAAFT